MRAIRSFALPLLGTLLVASGCRGGDAAPAEAARAPAPSEAAAPAGPTEGDREFDRITAAWDQATLDACGRQLRDALGTRDLVVGATDGVNDPDGRATAEVEDARRWIARGDEQLDAAKTKLEAGTCDGDVTVALDEAVQFYVKAGTSAVQAGQMAGS